MSPPESPGRIVAQLEEGTLINERYEIRDLIGTGGFAVVYEAFDTLIQRQVAVKLLEVATVGITEKELATKLERFNREARAAASIDHPNVVTIYDMGIHENRQPYIVMERLHGHDLAQEIEQRGALEPARALDLLGRALRALGEGHAQGIVHKDLKPSNLFLTYPGTGREDIRVLDFGIARLDTQDASLTGTGQVLGTPRYLAPEYIKDQTVTPALDVYQMGLILIEALTGKAAIATTNPLDCIVRHSRGEIEIEPWLQRGLLWKVLGKALDIDHRARFEHAGALAKALAEVDPGALKPAPKAAPGGLLPFAFDALSVADEEESEDIEIALVEDVAPMPTRRARPSRPISPPIALVEESRLPSLDLELGASDKSAMGMIGDEKPKLPDLTPIGLPTPTKLTPPPDARPPRPEPRPEPPDRSQFILWVGLAGVAVGLVAALLFLAFGNPSDDEVQKAPTEEAFVDDRIAVEVVTAPPGATLIQSGKILGKSPMTLRFDKEGSEPRRVSVHHEGFYPRKLSISAKDAPQKVIELRTIGD